MNRRYVRLSIMGAFIILIVAQFLNAVLSISSFEQTFRETLIAGFQIPAREFRRQVETSVNYGKPISLFGGMESVFKNIMSSDPDIAGLYVTLPDRAVLHATDPAAVGNILGSAEFPGFSDHPTAADLDASVVTPYKESLFISLPVYYNDEQLQGVVHLEFKRSLISERVKVVIRDTLVYFIPTLLGALLLSVPALILVSRGHERKAEGKRRWSLSTKTSLTVVAVLLLAQASYAFLNNRYFQSVYIKLFDQSVSDLSAVVSRDFQYVLGYGLPIERLRKADVVLGEHLSHSPAATEMAVTDTNGRVMYQATADDKGKVAVAGILENPGGLRSQPFSLETTEVRRVSALRAGDAVIGHLVTLVNEKLIQRRLFDILADALTIIVVSLVFSLEMVRLLTLLGGREPGAAKETTVADRNLKVIRLTAFLFFFSALIPLSFLPAFIEKIFDAHPVSFLGMSREALISIPLASYLLGITIFVPVVGFLTGRLSVRTIFFISCGFFIVGSFATAFPVTLIGLTLARFVSGIGYGGVMINAANLIVGSTVERNRATGFGFWSAGYAAAAICAISIGGVVVNRLGFTVGILVSTVFALVLAAFIFFYVKPEKAAVETRSIRLRDVVTLFRDRSIVANLLFSSIPFSFAYIGLFQYIFPLYMNSEGVSPADIGRILTVYGLISLITPLVSRLADRFRNEKYLIIIANALTGASLLLFMLFGNITVLILVIVCMAFGGMIIDAVEESFLVSSKEAKRIGEAKLLSLYTTYDKITSVFVPVAAGVLITAMGFVKSIGAIGAFTLVGAILFALISRNLRTQTVPGTETAAALTSDGGKGG